MEIEVQEYQEELQANKKAIVSIESKLQDVDCENEGEIKKRMVVFVLSNKILSTFFSMIFLTSHGLLIYLFLLT